MKNIIRCIFIVSKTDFSSNGSTLTTIIFSNIAIEYIYLMNFLTRTTSSFPLMLYKIQREKKKLFVKFNERTALIQRNDNVSNQWHSTKKN